MKGKILLLGLFVLLVAGSLVSAECCERTISGAWCQDEVASQCDSDYNSAPTSCDQVDYCRTGTCIDQEEGRCLPNTPKKVCEDEGGFWSADSVTELPQCSYGCCIYGQDTAFVTQSRCETLSSLFGFESTYRPDITNEIQCIAEAGGSEMGACVVVREDSARNCRMLTKSECNALESNAGSANIEFHEGYLCSAEFLGTTCGPRGGTTCTEDSSEVYFLDTCGNLANIYDVSRLNDPLYWESIYEKEESCGYDDMDGNANSPSCGNCEYLLGSTCEEYVRGENTKPTYGTSVCADLSCEYNGQTYKHGERWCATSAEYSKSTTRTVKTSLLDFKGASYSKDLDNGIFLPGEETYVMACYNGEVIPTSCSTGNWRNQICIETEVNDISYAECSANLWSDCLEQTTEEACSDYQMRDCKWIEGYSIYRDSENKPMTKDENGRTVEATCTPRFAPANDFWNADGETGAICELATRVVLAEYKFPVTVNRKKMDGDNLEDQKARLKYCESNCEALEAHVNHEEWMDTMNEICASLGDCSATVNYLGYEGYYDPEELLIQHFVRKAKNVEDELENI